MLCGSLWVCMYSHCYQMTTQTLAQASQAVVNRRQKSSFFSQPMQVVFSETVILWLSTGPCPAVGKSRGCKKRPVAS